MGEAIASRWAVVVTGGRDYRGGQQLFDALDRIKTDCGRVLLVHGGATGADAVAQEWANKRAVPQLRWPADWVKSGRSAGPKRNAAMGSFVAAAFQHVVGVVCPGGRGTAHMRGVMERHGWPIVEVTDG